MAVVTWKLTKELTVRQWEHVTQTLQALVEKGLPVLVEAQKKKMPDKGWRAMLARRQRELFLKMNEPAYQWGLDGRGFDTVRLVLLPGPFSTDDPEHAQQLALEIHRLPHEGSMELGERLHAFAWLGFLLLEHQKHPGVWRFQTDIAPSDLAALAAWARSVTLKI